MNDHELPGMWEQADLTGGETDTDFWEQVNPTRISPRAQRATRKPKPLAEPKYNMAERVRVYRYAEYGRVEQVIRNTRKCMYVVKLDSGKTVTVSDFMLEHVK